MDVNLSKLSCEPQKAVQFIMDALFSKIYPMTLRIRNKLKENYEILPSDNISTIQDMYSLCGNQIKKTVLNLLDIFKLEYRYSISMQECRQFAFERLLWCVNKLECIEQCLQKDNLKITNHYDISNSIFVTPMFFVNWIDHTFEILAKLSDVIYKTNYYEDHENQSQQWKHEVLECVIELHTCIDELLLSAMTVCRYCLFADQHIIKVRCQVVLRETKALLHELLKDNANDTFKVSPSTLKLPIMPSNVNLLIDVLKDVLNVLETNTNTALLALLVHCFMNSRSPIDLLKDHCANSTKDGCSCHPDDTPTDCSVVRDFDLYNERLLQIATFAVSCSSDQSRILSLRSSLSTLEALEPHLVPAVMMSPNSYHTALLMNMWKQEVQEIKENVFLIIDLGAFAEKSKQMMHQILLELLMEKIYNNNKVCAVINIGCVVHDFFCVYNKYEPDALVHHDKLVPLLADLDKVQMECKLVSNILSSGDDFIYQVVVKGNKKEASIEQMLKRLKLLYTLVNRIDELFHPEENDDQLFAYELCEEELPVPNVTRTVNPINTNTYINSPRKPVCNISRSTFARASNLRSSTNKFPLAKLTKRFKGKFGKYCEELNFSVKLDELLEISSSKIKANKTATQICDPPVFTFSPSKTRASLRRAVLNRLPFHKMEMKIVGNNDSYEKSSLVDETMSLQITDVLNEINDLTRSISTNIVGRDTTYAVSNATNKNAKDKSLQRNILTLNINNQNTTISKHIWNIPVNASTVKVPLDESAIVGTPNTTNLTQPSNVTTLERINDLDLVESKLSNLRSLEFETSL